MIEIVITKNEFIQNTAFLEGGAIKWTQKTPNIDNFNIFRINKAKYGDDKASYPIRNRIKVMSLNDSSFIDSLKSEIKLEGLASGSQTDFNIILETVDHSGNTVKTANKSISTLFVYIKSPF